MNNCYNCGVGIDDNNRWDVRYSSEIDAWCVYCYKCAKDVRMKEIEAEIAERATQGKETSLAKNAQTGE